MIDQREEFVRLARQERSNVSELCRRFGISRKTGYKWLGREQLQDSSRRPRSSPTRTDSELEARVVALRAEHPAWGGRKIAWVLERDHGLQIAPSTVTSVLHRHGLISDKASQAATAWQRFEHERPNAMWQMDFKGHFALSTGRCHPLTVLDDHSRFNVLLHALDNERREPVQAALQGAFERYGLPDRINADNGPPWGHSGLGGLTALGVWLLRLGVGLSYSRPAHPQTNGKDERFHRTLAAEAIQGHVLLDLTHAQEHLSKWRHVYNFKRPHQALQMATPASRYEMSQRAMPQTLPEIEYGPDDTVRHVQQGGWISLHGRQIRLSTALRGQPVALRPRADQDGVLDVYFCHQKLDTIELHSAC